MATKPSWDGKYRQFCRMMKGNGYSISHTSGSHVMWTNKDGKNILTCSEKHLSTGNAWQTINHNKLAWRSYI